MHAKHRPDRAGMLAAILPGRRIEGVMQRWQTLERNGTAKQKRYDANRVTWEEFKRILEENNRWLNGTDVPDAYRSEQESRMPQSIESLAELSALITQHRVRIFTFFKLFESQMNLEFEFERKMIFFLLLGIC